MSPGIQDLLKHGGRFTAELLIVFIGVSAAFMVDNYRDKLEDQHRLSQAYEGFIVELQHLSDRSRYHADHARQALNDYTQARAAGKYPPPAVYRVPGSEHPPRAVWNTSVASGVVNLMPPDLRLDLGHFYEEQWGIADRYIRYAEFTESDVLPAMKAHEDRFYDPKTHLLYPQYSAYMDRLLEYANYMDKQADWADKLIARIQAEQTPHYD